MKTLKKVWAFVKSWWFLFAVGIGMLIVGIFWRPARNHYIEFTKDAKKAYDRELFIIKQSEREKEQRLKKLEVEYNIAKHRLEKVFKIKEEQLNNKQKKRILELVEEFKHDPDLACVQFAKEFELECVKSAK